MITVDKGRCTACGACVQVCSKDCIVLKEDCDGYLYPYIKADLCIECGRCVEVCPIGKSSNIAHKVFSAYAAVRKDKNEILLSTSGGVFAALSNYVISKGGVVFGCAYTKNLKPMHMRVVTKKDCLALYESKYIQSDTSDSFIKVKRDLSDNRLVLYSGTPCQIAGLREFLGREYNNLVTVDLICHGVPSYAYFEKFLEALANKYNAKITDFHFRSKKNYNKLYSGTYSGYYSGIFQDNRVFLRPLNYFDHYYYFYFLNGDIYRECCYSCEYANLNRMGDFTLGDLWGAEGFSLGFRTNLGCSLVLVNTEKAQRILPKLDLCTRSISIDAAMKGNAQLNRPSPKSPVRDELLRRYREYKGEEIQRLFLRECRRQILFAKLKYLMPKVIRNNLLRIRYHGIDRHLPKSYVD